MTGDGAMNSMMTSHALPPYMVVASEPSLSDFTVARLSEHEKVLYGKLNSVREESEPSGMEFPADLVALFPLGGYWSKEHAKQVLIERSGLLENIDFKIYNATSENVEEDMFTTSERILLTWHAAQVFVMQGPTKVSEEIRRFFVHILQLHQDYIMLQAERRTASAVADVRHEEILAAHGDEQGVYLGTIGWQSVESHDKLFKFGFASKVKERVRAHANAFPLFRLVHFQRTSQAAEVERAFKTHPTIRNHQMTVVDKFGKNQTEILCLGEQFSKEEAVNLLTRKSKELTSSTRDGKQLDLERSKEEQERQKSEQLRLQVELARLAMALESSCVAVSDQANPATSPCSTDNIAVRYNVEAQMISSDLRAFVVEHCEYAIGERMSVEDLKSGFEDRMGCPFPMRGGVKKIVKLDPRYKETRFNACGACDSIASGGKCCDAYNKANRKKIPSVCNLKFK
ncbi:hypothetical protein HDU93_009108 [Gonapodya sp. JEL0774]|nr:hypothetical protein HDU93_009108 [Gonapodya sp. JEL0774]